MCELLDASSGSVLVARVDVAPRFSARSARGLLGTDGLPAGGGLLLSDPLRCIHTIGMRFPIDVVFLDRALTVVDVAERVGPWRVRWCRRGFHQLELASGRARELGLEPGTRVRLRARTGGDGGQHRARSPHGARRGSSAAHGAPESRCGSADRLPTLPPSAGRSGDMHTHL